MIDSVGVSQNEKNRVRAKAAEHGLDSLTPREKEIHRELFWDETGGKVERHEEKTILDANAKHVWEVEDAKKRSIICKSCSTPHGHILHPIHEWNLIDGVLYHKEKDGWVVWTS